MQENPPIVKHIFGRWSHITESFYDIDALGDNFVQLNEMDGYEMMIIIFVALYLIYIGRTLSNRSGVSFRISNPFAKITEAEGLGGSLRIGDLLLDWAMVVVMLVLFTSRMVDLLYPYFRPIGALALRIFDIGVILWMVGVGIAFVITLIYGILNTAIMTSLLRREGMMRGFTLTKSRLLHIAVVWIFPILLLSAMEGENLFFTYIAIIQIVIFIGIYLFRSLLLFTSQKISILHWILYLCAVEIFPLSLWWAFFVR